MADRPALTVAVVMRRERLTGEAARWLAWRWSLADVVLQDPLGLPDGLAPFRLETEPDGAAAGGPDGGAAASGARGDVADDAPGHSADRGADDVPADGAGGGAGGGAADRMGDRTADGAADGTGASAGRAASGQALRGIEPAADAYWMFPGFKVELFRDDGEGLYLNLTTPRPCFWVLWRHESERDPASLPQPEVVTLSYHDAGRWLDAQERVDQVPAPAAVIEWMRDFVTEHYRPEPKRRRRPQSFQPLTDRFGNPARIATGKNRGGGAHGD